MLVKSIAPMLIVFRFIPVMTIGTLTFVICALETDPEIDTPLSLSKSMFVLMIGVTRRVKPKTPALNETPCALAWMLLMANGAVL